MGIPSAASGSARLSVTGRWRGKPGDGFQMGVEGGNSNSGRGGRQWALRSGTRQTKPLCFTGASVKRGNSDYAPTIPVRELGPHIASLANQQWDIGNALDMLISGF